MYIGPATVEAPTPRPPINLNKENEYASGAKAEPIADTKYSAPIQMSVFFRPIRCVGIPPKSEPATVPHKAIDMINVPWNNGVVSQSSLMGRLAPDITTVSKPNRNPASEAVNDHKF